MLTPPHPISSPSKLSADTTWFHVFRAFMFNGDCARLGPHATTVLLAVKAHTNFETGCAFPSIEKIIVCTAISKRQIINSLKALEQAGYLTKTKKGRSNHYQVREKVHLMDRQGRPAAVATWDYLPYAIKETCAQLKSFLLSGAIHHDTASPAMIYIEHINLNFQVVQSGGVGTQVNGGST